MNDDDLTVMLTRGHCPDCTGRGFVIGPMGGRSINIECANLRCRSRFNVAFISGNAVMAQRIDRASVWPSEPARHSRDFPTEP